MCGVFRMRKLRGDGVDTVQTMSDADRFKWLPWVILLAFALALQVHVEPEWVPGWDSSLYILTGASLHAGDGYSYLGLCLCRSFRL
jgi:hypothetical protein